MRLKVIWPGRTKSASVRELEGHYLRRIRELAPCEVIVTETARGLDERAAAKILEIEARGLEKRLKDDYIVCLFDRGQEMSSVEFAQFLGEREASGGRSVAFLVGGFLGLAGRLLERADLRLSLSRMTLSHELARAVLLEQIYRSLALMKGRSYAK
jgi:23S rRNA (pseudouridine1915-N3)-methyltransferase